MGKRTRAGLAALAAGAALGVCADAVLRPAPAGINVCVFTAALVCAVAFAVRERGSELCRRPHSMLFAALFFAACVAWRDSSTLKALDGCAVVAALALAGLCSRGGRIVLAGISEYAGALWRTCLDCVLGAWRLVDRDIAWEEIPSEGWAPKARAVGRGLLLAAPLVLVFGALFVAADASFERLVNNLFRIDLDSVIAHVSIALVCGWKAAGFLRGVMFGENAAPEGGRRARTALLGAIEIGIVLAALDLLFLTFVAVQVRYLFGGAGRIRAVAGLTCAAYARRGFFELVTVAAIALPLLLLFHWMLRGDDPWSERLFRWLAGLQVGLLFVVMASALHRMLLYQSAFGLTELRVYTTAFMGWLAVVFVWFAWTALRGRRERFAYGALMAAFTFIAGLHVLNPDEVIVHTNLARATGTRRFDVAYATSLSLDAVPALVAARPALRDEEQYALSQRLRYRMSRAARWWDWRLWSWSRMKAFAARESPTIGGQDARATRAEF